MIKKLMTGVLASGVATAVFASGGDFGLNMEKELHHESMRYFGIDKPLRGSATGTVARVPGQPASDIVSLAGGLKASFLTRKAGNWTDQMVFWPSREHPEYLITAVEVFRPYVIGSFPGGQPKWTPALQRIRLSDGKAEIILRGLAGADPVRRTAWGTIIVGEENTGSGHVYEILDPVHTTDVTIVSRGSNDFVDSDGNPVVGEIALRDALPVIGWEGIGVLPNGVVYAGNELRPGTFGADTDGGSLYKFVPARPYSGGGHITDLADSPLASGNVYALQISCKDSKQQFGQGCEIGNGAWIQVNAATAISDADSLGATGFYRPEDMDIDPMYKGAGVRLCWTNTGNEGGGNYGEVMCGVDREPLATTAGRRTVVINRFLEGDADFNSVDNVAFQPGTGNLYVIEDHKNGDVFACLPDGKDRDIKTDGCVKMLSVKDRSAEPTGYIFSADGRTAYVSIQHSGDAAMPMVDDYGTDDVIRITGFKLPVRGHDREQDN